MPMTPLTGLDRTSPTFRTALDTFFLTALPQFVTEANDLQTDVNAQQLTATGAAATATEQAALADADRLVALAAADQATTAAASAINAPGTSATSTTSLTVGVGSQSLTVQTGKLFAVGQTVVLAYSADPANVQMSGVITSHNSATGAMVVQVPTGAVAGSGTYSAWTVSVTAAVVATQRIITAAGALAGPYAIDASTIFSIAMS